ncbi:MAG: hypothetical protein H7837_12060 [Magnetococcus sp. MYC-9]
MSKVIPVILLSGLLGVLSGCASQQAKPDAAVEQKADKAAIDKAKADADAARRDADRAKEDAARAKKAYRKGLNK